jgi:hypothetical protein
MRSQETISGVSSNDVPSGKAWRDFAESLTRNRLILAIASSILLLSLPPLYAKETLPLNSGPVEPSLKTTNEFIEMFILKQKPKTLHGLITFPRYVTQNDRIYLARFGIHVLELYRNTTYWVTVGRSVNSNQLKSLKINFYLTKLQDIDRVNPDIWNHNYDKFKARQPADQSPLNYLVNLYDDGSLKSLNLTIMFHSDVTERQAKAVIKKYATNIKKKSDVSWVIVAPPTAVQALAQDDLVRWIGAGPIPARPENDYTRRAIKVDNVQNFDTTNGFGAWTGAWGDNGIRVGVFDWGIAWGHPDFGDRVKMTFQDPLNPNPDGHATRIAGTIAGSGKMSDGNLGCNFTGANGSKYQWRGMAPAAYLQDEWWQDGDNVALHKDRITNPGMHVSNHSYEVSYDGEYNNPSDYNRDYIIKGVQPGGTPFCGSSSFCPRLHVYSAGDTGDPCQTATGLCDAKPFQSGYFALSKQVKNAIVVGNWDYITRAGPTTTSATDKPNQIHTGATTDFLGSSLGPAHDGRIKPDVVAPGTDLCSTRDSGTFYGNITGSSISAAAVSGSLVILLQKYANIYHIKDLNERAPLPSTLRAVIIHTADDITVPVGDPEWFSNADGPVKPTPGPDFVTGWGLVNVEKASPIVDKQYLWEDKLTNQCETKVYNFSVGAEPVRVTLAWDDPPYAGADLPRRNRRLVNDLDLTLIDPNGGIHYSWKLDQTIVDPSNGGTPIPDDGQICSTPINDENISRQFLPTENPDQSNDDTTGGIPSAGRGRDHINNVEVVDVDVNAATPAIPGTWQAKVTVFRIDSYWGAQWFSLVGYPFHEASVHTFCGANPLVCGPQTRKWTLIVPDPSTGQIKGKFDSPENKIIARMRTLCELGFTCPPCAAKKSCKTYKIQLGKMVTQLTLEVYTQKGKLVGRDASSSPTKNIYFHARPDEDYFLVLSPARGTQIGEEFDVALVIEE